MNKDNYGYLEFWNPTAQQLNNLDRFLEENRTIAFVWLYGKVEDIDDFSSLNFSRVAKPVYLGTSKKLAEKFLYQNRDSLVGKLINA